MASYELYLNLPRAVRADLEKAVTELVHDVAKYIARTARNVVTPPAQPRPGSPPPEPLPPPLHKMLIRDLYGDENLPRPRALFVPRALQIARHVPDTRLVEARARLARLDELEPEVRAGALLAIGEACTAAREIEQLIRAIAADAQRAFELNQSPGLRRPPEPREPGAPRGRGKRLP